MVRLSEVDILSDSIQGQSSQNIQFALPPQRWRTCGPTAEQPHLKAIYFCVLRNDICLVEYSKKLTPTSSRLEYNDDQDILRAILGDTRHEGDYSTLSVAIKTQSVTRVSIGHDGTDHYMLLELAYNPRFEIHPTLNNRRNNLHHHWSRLSQFDQEHGRIAPYASRCLKIVFHEDTPSIPTEHTCDETRLPPPRMDANIIFDHERQLYSRQNIERVDNWLRSGSLPWEVAFQCEAILRNGYLFPTEVMALRPQVEQIASELPVLACDALKTLRDELKAGTRGMLTGFEGDEIPALFDRHIGQAMQAPGYNMESSSSKFLYHHVKVTPTAIYLDGPYIEKSNRVVRRYPGFESYFIRVDIEDEDGSLRLGDRKYEFLAYSLTGLREHSLFFSAEFMHNGLLVDPKSILTSLGHFSLVIHCPARYGARMSQAFSATDPSIALSPRAVTCIPDILNSSGELFSYGCGTISRDLAERVWRGWLDNLPSIQRSRRRRNEPVPAAFQIKMGGCEGMVRIDPKLAGEQICIRPSMSKFEAPNELNLEIVRAFERPSPCFLNRPLAMILCTNGVDPSVIEQLMKDTLISIYTAMETSDGIRAVMLSNHLGQAFRLGNIFVELSNLGIQLNWRSVPNPGLQKLLDRVLYHIKLGLNYRLRIEVPHSYTLVGVCDEDSYLQPREIYACVQTFDHKTGMIQRKFIKGWVLVARNPVIHPGDCQRLYAIGEPPIDSPFAGEGNHLPNCVVFSSRGVRSVPNILGGGNLSGDLYSIIQLPELFPPHQYVPAFYPPSVLKCIQSESTISDVADFAVEFMRDDNLGAVAMNHLLLASMASEGARSFNCLVNAGLHAKAIDFIKTGLPVYLDGIRRPRFRVDELTGRNLYPDWTSKQGEDPEGMRYYACPSVLGRLFRAVELPLNTPADDDLASPDGQEQPGTIRTVLAGHVAKYQTKIRDAYTTATPWAQALFARYTLELNHICVSHSPPGQSTKRISEIDVMLGANPGLSPNSSLIERMKVQTQNLCEFVRLQLEGETNDWHKRLARAWRAYTLTSNMSDEDFGSFSFSWIALGSVLEALSELDPNFLNHLDSVWPLSSTATAHRENVQADSYGVEGDNHIDWIWESCDSARPGRGRGRGNIRGFRPEAGGLNNSSMPGSASNRVSSSYRRW